jgi:hypothetical protein
MEIRSTTICYSKNKAKDTRVKLQEAMMQVNLLENKLNTDPNDVILELYTEHKKYIENYNNEKANGAITRSRVDWAEYGERNSKFFLNLEKRNHNMKSITKLIKENEEEISEPKQILKYEEEFYKNLYSSPGSKYTVNEKEKAATFFKDEMLPEISE